MKFKTNRDHFANGLSQVLNVVGSKATMPILSNVLIEAEKDQLSLTTTNLDLGIRCKIKAEVKEGGAVTLPVKRLANIVRELPNSDVAVDASPNHQVKLSSGGSTFRIMGMGKDEFPPLPEFGDEKAYTLQQAELAAMLRSVSYAQSQDETRYTLNGVYFNFKEGSLSLVATDGRHGSNHPAGEDGQRAGADPRQRRQGKDQLQRPPLRLPDSNGQGWKRPGRQRVSVLEGRGGNVPELPAGDPQGDAPANQARAGASAAVRAPRGARMLGKVKFGADEADKQPS